MKWFNAGTKKMSAPSFSSIIKLNKVQCTMTVTWVLPQRRFPGNVIPPSMAAWARMNETAKHQVDQASA